MGSLGMRQIQVRATRDDDAPNGVRFELHEGGGKVPNDTLESRKQPNDSKHNDFHEFRFILQEHDTDLKFQTPASAAITTANADIEPVSVSAPRIATAISAAIRPYSIAVAARSSRRACAAFAVRADSASGIGWRCVSMAFTLGIAVAARSGGRRHRAGGA